MSMEDDPIIAQIVFPGHRLEFKAIGGLGSFLHVNNEVDAFYGIEKAFSIAIL